MIERHFGKRMDIGKTIGVVFVTVPDADDGAWLRRACGARHGRCTQSGESNNEGDKAGHGGQALQVATPPLWPSGLEEMLTLAVR